MAKIAISIAVDGLSNEAALRAAGIEDDAMITGLSVGQQLYTMMEAEFKDEAEVIPISRAIGGRRR